MQETGRESLRMLGGGLLSQIVAFGRTNGFSHGPSVALAKLIGVSRAFFQLLEKEVVLPCGDPELSFVANKSEWSPTVPVGGYLADEPGLLRSEVVRSYDVMWSLHFERGHAMAPALRGAAWVCSSRSYPDAVRYLLDLQRDGYLGGVKSLMQALHVLCWAREQTQEDRELPSVIFEKHPQTIEEWQSTQFRNELQGIDEPRNAAGTASIILRRCLELVDRVRASKSYVEWIVGQMNLAMLLQGALASVKQYLPEPSLVTRALLDQLEEIMADGMVFFAPVIAGVPLLRAEFSQARSLSRKLARIDQNQWKSRMLNERLQIPNALRHLVDDPNWLDDQTAIQLPKDWGFVSCDLAFPISLAVKGQDPSPFSAIHQNATQEDLDHAVRCAKQKQEAGDHAAAAGIFEEALETYPWCYFLRNGLAVSLIELQRLDEALAAAQLAVLTAPLERSTWASLEHVYRKGRMMDGARVARGVAERLQQ
jgi:tetratricopeptide (TPR) repeat protein